MGTGRDGRKKKKFPIDGPLPFILYLLSQTFIIDHRGKTVISFLSTVCDPALTVERCIIISD
jgi:hypothetical protein